MNPEFQYSAIRLERRQCIEVPDGAGASIACTSGLIWLTQDRQYADIVLPAGRSFVLDGRGTAVVQALSASTVRVTRPAPAGTVVAALKKLLVPVGAFGHG